MFLIIKIEVEALGSDTSCFK